MLAAPVKDTMMMAQKPLHDLPKVMDKLVEQGDARQQSSSRNRDLAMLLGAAGLGTAAYGGKKLFDHLRDRREADDMRPVVAPGSEGMVRITLPTRNPGDAETVVELPISSMKLPGSIAGKIHRDIRRKLRSEVEERTYHRDPQSGEVEAYDYEMPPPDDEMGKQAGMSRENPLGRAHEKIIPIRIPTARDQWLQQRQQQEKVKMDEMRQQAAMRKAERDLQDDPGQPGTPQPAGKPAAVSPLLKKRISEINRRVGRLGAYKYAYGEPYDPNWREPASNQYFGGIGERLQAAGRGQDYNYNAGINNGMGKYFKDDASVVDSLKGKAHMKLRQADRTMHKGLDKGILAIGGRFNNALTDARQSYGNTWQNWKKFYKDPRPSTSRDMMGSAWQAYKDTTAVARGALNPAAQWWSLGLAPSMGPAQSREAKFRQQMAGMPSFAKDTGEAPPWMQSQIWSVPKEEWYAQHPEAPRNAGD